MKAEITLRGKRVHVKTPYAPAIVDRFRSIPGRLFHGEDKTWSFPAVRDTLLMVCDVIGCLPMFLPEELRAIIGNPIGAFYRRLEADQGVLDNWKFLTEPYEHQKRNLATLMTHDRWFLADEMGTGKSFVIACRLCSRPTPTLIICPKTVIGTWIDQLHRHAGIAGVVPDAPLTAQTVTSKSPVIIMNYERLLTVDIENFIGFNRIIFDEIHRIKNFTGKTARICRKLSEQAQFVYGLSGTPAPNGLEDWFGVLAAIDPNLLPVNTKRDFEDRYCVKERLKDSNVWVIKGYRNVEELHQYISMVTSRVTKAECLDLPEKIICPRYVKLSGEQARIYIDIKIKAVATIISLRATGQLTVKNVLTEGLRLAQIVGGFVPDDDGQTHSLPEKAKMDGLYEILDECSDKQVVIWCAFKDEVYYIANMLEAHLGKTCLVSTLTSDTPAKLRPDNIEKFRTGQTQYFVGTAAAGGVGINGLQVADTEVYYSRTWSLTDWLQSQDRLHRIGQQNKVTIIPLIATDTIDERINAALERKFDLQEMMLARPEEVF